MTVYFIAATLIFAVTAAVGVVLYKFANKRLNLIFRVFSVVLGAMYIYRYCSGRENIDGIINLTVSRGFDSQAQLVFGLLQIWLGFAGELFLCMYPFFRKRVKYLDLFAGGFVAVFLVNFAGMGNHVLAVEGAQALTDITARGVVMALETGFCMAYSALALAMWIYERVRSAHNSVAAVSGANASVKAEPSEITVPEGRSEDELAQSRSEAELTARREKLAWVWPVLAVLGIIICTMPYYAPQLLLNPEKYAMKVIDLNLYHRLYIYPIAIIPVMLYLLLHDKSYETKRLVLLYYSLAMLNGIMLTHKFVDFVGNGWVTSLPLHLCNTALYVTPLCLTFKAKRVFYFTFGDNNAELRVGESQRFRSRCRHGGIFLRSLSGVFYAAAGSRTWHIPPSALEGVLLLAYRFRRVLRVDADTKRLVH